MGNDHGLSAVSTGDEADLAWADRCRYWRRLIPEKRHRGRPRRQTHEPLVLAGHGVCLRVGHGALVIRNGFTHYPQKVEEHRFFRGDRSLPSRIVVLDGSGSLSFETLSWLSEQNVPLIRINWRGEVVTALGTAHATDSKRVAAQLEAQRNGYGLRFAISLIRAKLQNSIDTLTLALPKSPSRDFAIARLNDAIHELTRRPPKTIGALLGVEGRGGLAYFKAWQSLPLRWKGVGRHPIPRDWYTVGPRYSYARKKGETRNASHPLNAILNYAYAILESQVRIQVLAAGFDPTIGFLHAGRRGRSDFVLDLMEPLRSIVDKQVLGFVQTHTFQPADFAIRSDGVVRLNPELAKCIAAIVLSSTEMTVPPVSMKRLADVGR